MSKLSPFRSNWNWLRPRSYSLRTEDQRLLVRIAARISEFSSVTDAELAEALARQNDRVRNGTSRLERSVICEVFACVSEAVYRRLGMRYYDVQLLAGLVLATGSIAEMKTGEGKTIVSALPATLAATTGRGVHVATVNSYLAERDCELLSPVYGLLGLSIGLLRDGDSPTDKREAYACDVTYGTGYEFGFDFLRDQIALQAAENRSLGEGFLAALRGENRGTDVTVQRQLACSIIDEIDSVLLDEANTPLVISGPNGGKGADKSVFQRARETIAELAEDVDYEIDARTKRVSLTEVGFNRVFDAQPPATSRPWNIYVEQALRAKLVLQRDVDYVVQQGEVRIVDPYTGRIFEERTWREGLHQAVETKEGVEVTSENRSLAQISRQQFYQQYDSLCGMTGTALGHEAELERFYKLAIVEVPQRKRCQRELLRPRLFVDRQHKIRAVAESIGELRQAGRPVLVGTRTIQATREISVRLAEMGLDHQVLNGTQDAEEAEIVSRAGQVGMILIATNMAGRGTDIKLSSEAESLGGLHVIGFEFHDSVRIDGQLAGRAARQGQPGSVQFFASAEDDLFDRYDPRLAETIKRQSKEADECRQDFTASIRRVQRVAQVESYQQRCAIFRQQQWLNKVLTTIAEPTHKNRLSTKTKGAA